MSSADSTAGLTRLMKAEGDAQKIIEDARNSACKIAPSVFFCFRPFLPSHRRSLSSVKLITNRYILYYVIQPAVLKLSAPKTRPRRRSRSTALLSRLTLPASRLRYVSDSAILSDQYLTFLSERVTCEARKQKPLKNSSSQTPSTLPTLPRLTCAATPPRQASVPHY